VSGTVVNNFIAISTFNLDNGLLSVFELLNNDKAAFTSATRPLLQQFSKYVKEKLDNYNNIRNTNG